jgi:hypothetical protein
MNTDRNKNNNFAFKLAKSFTDVSTTASVYAKISVLKELIVDLEIKILDLEKILEKIESNKGD